MRLAMGLETGSMKLVLLKRERRLRIAIEKRKHAYYEYKDFGDEAWIVFKLY